MNDSYKSVSQLLNEIKFRIEDGFTNIKIQGEVTNFSKALSGHYYFNLNDSVNSLNCALFKMDARFNKDLNGIKDGEKVFVEGKATVYMRRSSVQVVVKKISLQNKKGNLQEQFEKIKKQLALEGLFDLARKKEIPAHPRKIAVVTSPHGAAVQDFLKILMDKCYFYHVVIIPALVQGDTAEASLVSALKKAQEVEEVDVIVLTRGGGSLEDLWSFNSEKLAREIDACSIPIISAVGHEINHSICDFVADLRCPTPTAAAENLSLLQSKELIRFETLLARVNYFGGHLRDLIQGKLKQLNPKYAMSLLKEKINNAFKMLNVFNIEVLASRADLREKSYFLDEVFNKKCLLVGDRISAMDKRLSILNNVLKSVDPKRVLNRGYSYVSLSSRKVIASKSDFDKSKDQVYHINFHDGASEVRK